MGGGGEGDQEEKEGANKVGNIASTGRPRARLPSRSRLWRSMGSGSGALTSSGRPCVSSGSITTTATTT